MTLVIASPANVQHMLGPERLSEALREETNEVFDAWVEDNGAVGQVPDPHNSVLVTGRFVYGLAAFNNEM
jgi:hypothetical protein